MNPPLSPEQKRVQEAYQSLYWPTLLVCLLIWFVVFALLMWVIVAMGGRSDSAALGIASVFIMGVAHVWTVRKLKRRGLSLASEKVEIVTRTANNFLGKPAEWWSPKTFLASLANASVPFLMSGLGWFLWHWPFSEPSLLQKGLGIICLVLFLWAGIVGLVFLRSPHVRIDKDGIVAFPNPFWRNRAHWAKIASCELRTQTDFLGQGPIRSFRFQSADGKTLLRLNPGSLNGLSHEEQAEIELEIKRRLGHEPQNQPK